MVSKFPLTTIIVHSLNHTKRQRELDFIAKRNKVVLIICAIAMTEISFYRR